MRESQGKEESKEAYDLNKKRDPMYPFKKYVYGYVQMIFNDRYVTTFYIRNDKSLSIDEIMIRPLGSAT